MYTTEPSLYQAPRALAFWSLAEKKEASLQYPCRYNNIPLLPNCSPERGAFISLYEAQMN